MIRALALVVVLCGSVSAEPKCFRPEGDYEYVDYCWLFEDGKLAATANVDMFCDDNGKRSGQFVYPRDRYAGKSPKPAAKLAGNVVELGGQKLKLRKISSVERCDVRRRIAGLPPEAIEDACKTIARGCGSDCDELKAKVAAALKVKPDMLRGSVYRDKCP